MPQAAGNAPDQLTPGHTLGAFAFMQLDAFLIRPPASAMPQSPGDMVVQSTDNTLTFKRKDANGVVRVINLTWP